MTRRTLGFLGLVLLAAALAGCERKFTHERFEMISEGFDKKEDVRDLLGKPYAMTEGQWHYRDLDRHQEAEIWFDERGLVRGKQWSDGKTGEIEGRNPDASPPPEGEVREEETRVRRLDD
jgi:hypothetical protein